MLNFDSRSFPPQRKRRTRDNLPCGALSVNLPNNILLFRCHERATSKSSSSLFSPNVSCRGLLRTIAVVGMELLPAGEVISPSRSAMGLLLKDGCCCCCCASCSSSPSSLVSLLLLSLLKELLMVLSEPYGRPDSLLSSSDPSAVSSEMTRASGSSAAAAPWDDGSRRRSIAAWGGG